MAGCKFRCNTPRRQQSKIIEACIETSMPTYDSTEARNHPLKFASPFISTLHFGQLILWSCADSPPWTLIPEIPNVSDMATGNQRASGRDRICTAQTMMSCNHGLPPASKLELSVRFNLTARQIAYKPALSRLSLQEPHSCHNNRTDT